jgi:hypothetical protein
MYAQNTETLGFKILKVPCLLQLTIMRFEKKNHFTHTKQICGQNTVCDISGSHCGEYEV